MWGYRFLPDGIFGARYPMILNRLMLFVLTALIGVAAIYFWIIQLVAVAAALLMVLAVIGGAVLLLRRKPKP